MYQLAQLAVVVVGTVAGMIAARAFVELLVRADRRARLSDVRYIRSDRW
jgi:hypothetical protein